MGAAAAPQVKSVALPVPSIIVHINIPPPAAPSSCAAHRSVDFDDSSCRGGFNQRLRRVLNGQGRSGSSRCQYGRDYGSAKSAETPTAFKTASQMLCCASSPVDQSSRHPRCSTVCRKLRPADKVEPDLYVSGYIFKGQGRACRKSASDCPVIRENACRYSKLGP